MNKKYNIGIVGLGYVGKAIFNAFSSVNNIFTYDMKVKSSESNLQSLVVKSEIIFICLPTPMKKDGSCSLDIITNSLDIITKTIEDLNTFNIKKHIVIKSTVPPGTCLNLQENNTNLNIIFNPEFLTESNFNDDFLNQNRIVLGGSDVEEIKSLYNSRFPEIEIIDLNYKEAEMVKYFANTFLATKVSFANELYTLCNKMGVNYDIVVKTAIKDQRIGKTHFQVPGPDGKFGFGGSCFPKDISALISVFKANNVDTLVLNSVWERNQTIDRIEKDWEFLKGRAIE